MIKNPKLIHNNYARWLIYGLLVIYSILFLSSRTFSLSDDNGFELDNSLIPVDEIYHGGPPRDGIPAIDEPNYINANNATFLNSKDRILGLNYDGVTRAYPVKILNYHEIVNDKIRGKSVVISYCPLCGSGMAFKSGLNNSNNTFGVSGLLYNNDMLLYDRETQSLWSQIMSMAISGKMKGTQLHALPLSDTTWAHWREKHPQTQVLSTKTGYLRRYEKHPYGEYDQNDAIYFPVSNSTARFHPKERVLGIVIDNKAKAYPFIELSKQGKTRFNDTLATQSLTIEYDTVSQSALIYDSNNRLLTSTTLFWFAWYSFYPETEIYTYKQ